MIKTQKVIKYVFRYEIGFSLKNSDFSYFFGSISYEKKSLFFPDGNVLILASPFSGCSDLWASLLGGSELWVYGILAG
jgi:hypothetical protein